MSIQVFIVEFIHLFLWNYFHCFSTLKTLPDPQIRKIFIQVVFTFDFQIHLEYNLLCDVTQDFKVISPPPTQVTYVSCWNLYIICISFPLEMVYTGKAPVSKRPHWRSLSTSLSTAPNPANNMKACGRLKYLWDDFFCPLLSFLQLFMQLKESN